MFCEVNPFPSICVEFVTTSRKCLWSLHRTLPIFTTMVFSVDNQECSVYRESSNDSYTGSDEKKVTTIPENYEFINLVSLIEMRNWLGPRSHLSVFFIELIASCKFYNLQLVNFPGWPKSMRQTSVIDLSTRIRRGIHQTYLISKKSIFYMNRHFVRNIRLSTYKIQNVFRNRTGTSTLGGLSVCLRYLSVSPIHYDSSASTTAMTGKGIPPKLNFVNLQLTTCKFLTIYNL